MRFSPLSALSQQISPYRTYAAERVSFNKSINVFEMQWIIEIILR
jgi:hypothetical protein